VTQRPEPVAQLAGGIWPLRDQESSRALVRTMQEQKVTSSGSICGRSATRDKWNGSSPPSLAALPGSFGLEPTPRRSDCTGGA